MKTHACLCGCVNPECLVSFHVSLFIKNLIYIDCIWYGDLSSFGIPRTKFNENSTKTFFFLKARFAWIPIGTNKNRKIQPGIRQFFLLFVLKMRSFNEPKPFKCLKIYIKKKAQSVAFQIKLQYWGSIIFRFRIPFEFVHVFFLRFMKKSKHILKTSLVVVSAWIGWAQLSKTILSVLSDTCYILD